MCSLFFVVAVCSPPAALAATADPAEKLSKPNAAFDANKMSDMSDFDPANVVLPTGDTIKIAMVASFSGPAANTGQSYWGFVSFAAHDINKRGASGWTEKRS
jgi:ABC-type branched-subunit amino acid transport system substrate-binding protein